MVFCMKARESVEKMTERDWGPSPSEGIFLNSTACVILPPESVLQAIVASSKACFNYPDPYKKSLMRSLAGYTGFREENLFVGNGSAKILRVIAECFIENGDTVLAFNPSFSVFNSAVELMGGEIVELDLLEKQGFAIPFEQVFSLTREKNVKAIYLANPNNPTGNLLLDELPLRKLLETGVLVVLDECYCEFSGSSFSGLVREFDNLIVVRSLSKSFGMTGLRIGYSIASPEIMRLMTKVENAIEIFNCSSVSLDAAVAALGEQEYYSNGRARGMQLGAKLAGVLEKFGIKCSFQKTPFLFCHVSAVASASSFAKALERQNVFVKCYLDFGDKFVRIGIPGEKDFEKVAIAVERTVEGLK